MRVVAVTCLAICSALVFPVEAAPFRLCKNEVVQSRSLYVRVNSGHSLGCWRQVQNSLFIDEGSRTASNLPVLPPGGAANFAYLIEQPESSQTVVVVKERVMRLQRDNSSGTYQPQPAANPPNDIILVRPPVISNRCGERPQAYGPDPGTRRGIVNIGEYNRYHEQELTFGFVRNAIPRSDQLRDFHFKYPVAAKPGCRDSDDYATGNRRQYAFVGLSNTSDPSAVGKIARAILPSAYASNGYYTKLKVRNIYVNGSKNSGIQPNDQSMTGYSVVTFTGDSDPYTRTELTISNLEAYRDGIHWPSTWQMDWVDVTSRTSKNSGFNLMSTQ
jgi:hypothetical protein